MSNDEQIYVHASDGRIETEMSADMTAQIKATCEGLTGVSTKELLAIARGPEAPIEAFEELLGRGKKSRKDFLGEEDPLPVA